MNPLGTPNTGVVVTGGASGIGRACCLALAEGGRPSGPPPSGLELLLV